MHIFICVYVCVLGGRGICDFHCLVNVSPDAVDSKVVLIKYSPTT